MERINTTQDNTMTYSESADGIDITWERAIRELDRHGVPHTEHTAFAVECWSIHATDNTIPAIRVLEWLGY